MPSRAGTLIRQLRAALDRSLLRPAPPDKLKLKGWEGALVIVAFLVLAAVLQLFRLGPATALNSLWAEDGAVFLNGAMTQGFLDAMTMTHGEYLVVVPRLLAEVGTVVPLHDAAIAMNLATVFIIALSGLAVWFAAAGQIHSPYLRALLMALLVLCPVSSIEAVASPTNVAWYMAFAVFWLLLWRPATTWGACLGGLLILATGISTPATLFFIPIAVLRAVAIRDRRDALVVGAFALGMAIQVPATMLSDEQLPGSDWSSHIVTAFLQRVVDSSVLGLELGGSTWADWGWPFLIAIVAGAAVFLVAMALRAPSGRLVAAIAIATSVAMFISSAYVRAPLGDFMVWRTDEYTSLGGRYAMIPALLLISAALVLVDSRWRSSRGRPVAAIATAAVLLVALVTSFDARGEIGRGGPPWDESLRTATAQCKAKDLAEVPVATAPEGWTMLIACDRLVPEDG
jgi:Na+-translocating ferredoxin:NAD+ oxidoreductase RnfA subunit